MLNRAGQIALLIIALAGANSPVRAADERTIEGAHEFVRLTLGDGTAYTYQMVDVSARGYGHPPKPYLDTPARLIRRVESSGCATTLYNDDKEGSGYRKIDWTRVTDAVWTEGIIVVFGPITANNGGFTAQVSRIQILHKDLYRIQEAMRFIRQRCDARGSTGF